MNICQVHDCTNKHQAKGYCSSHYSRVRRHGHTESIRGSKSPKLCFLHDCDSRARALSLCQRHYAQIKRYGHIFNEQELAEMRSVKRRNSKQASGWKWSEESRAAFSKKLKGRRLNTGRTHFKKGHEPWNTGMSGWLTESHRESLKRANTGNTYTKGIKRPYMTGENNPNWKGGKVSQNYKDRRTFRKNYQKEVFERDDYVCQKCKKRGGWLQVDHIKGWSDHPELRFDIDNCQTLCMSCHYFKTFNKEMPKGIVWGHNLSRRIAS